MIPASAYVDNGCYWYAGVATVKKATSIPTGWNASLVAASTTWNNAGADFRFSWSAVSTNYLYYSSLGSDGLIARAYPDADGDRMEACYVRFNSDYSWLTSGESGKYDVQNIATHEFGYWLTLGHPPDDTEATMYEYSKLGETKKRSLTSDDIAGIRSIYP